MLTMAIIHCAFVPQRNHSRDRCTALKNRDQINE